MSFLSPHWTPNLPFPQPAPEISKPNQKLLDGLPGWEGNGCSAPSRPRTSMVWPEQPQHNFPGSLTGITETILPCLSAHGKLGSSITSPCRHNAEQPDKSHRWVSCRLDALFVGLPLKWTWELPIADVQLIILTKRIWQQTSGNGRLSIFAHVRLLEGCHLLFP